jgi:hypothetical protein
VFCCFNKSYKISEPVFTVWMRLLRAIEGSVLWLSDHPGERNDKMRENAQARGVDPARLVFAPNLAARADHFARHRLADLFLDTLPYNAHTTACDALFAGLPVLTATGPTFVGRVAASMLHAAVPASWATGASTTNDGARPRAIGSPQAIRAGLPPAAYHFFDTGRAPISRRPMTGCGDLPGEGRRGPSTSRSNEACAASSA